MKKIFIVLLIFVFSCAKSYSQLYIQTSTATSGTITAVNTQQDVCLIHDASTTLTLTIAFPASPKDGQLFLMTSTNGITTLTLSATIGSIANSITTMVAGGNSTYMYSLAMNKWYKIR